MTTPAVVETEVEQKPSEPEVIDPRVLETEKGTPTDEPVEEKKEEEVVAPAAEEQKKEETPKTDEELLALRRMLVSQQKVIALLKQQQDVHKQSLAENQLLKEADPDEEKQAQLVVAQRQAQLDGYLETMRLNPKYQDVDEVISQENFDNLVLTLGQKYVAERGGDLTTAVTGLTNYIWAQANPYRYTYDLIKGMEQKAPAGDAPKPAASAAPKPVDAPPSLGALPAGGKGEGGWTAERIDNLPEDKLHTVPPAIYEKYLAGTL